MHVFMFSLSTTNSTDQTNNCRNRLVGNFDFATTKAMQLVLCTGSVVEHIKSCPPSGIQELPTHNWHLSLDNLLLAVPTFWTGDTDVPCDHLVTTVY